MTNPLARDLDDVLAQTGDLWQELRGQRLFITGGTGFFGCWLLESFAWATDRLGLDAEAVVLTRRPDDFAHKAPHLGAHPAIRLYRGDVRSFAFPDGLFSHIIHAATESSTQPKVDDPLLMLDTIVEGTRRTLDFAVHCGAGKFLLTSSGAVYGRQPPELTHVPEEYAGAPDTMDPRSAYGEGKRMAELLCALYAQRHGVETKIARCFAFVGPHLPLDGHFAVGNFIRDALAGGPIHIRGDGTPYRSYLYAADLAAWLWTILFRGASCRPYNVGSEAELTIATLAQVVADATTTCPEVLIHKRPDPARPAERYVPAAQRACRELGLKPKTELSHAVRKVTAHIFQESPNHGHR